MITNPNVERPTPLFEPSDLDAPPSNVGTIRVRKAGITLPDFDKILDETFGYIDTKIVNVDAKIFEGKGKNRRLNHYRSLREFAQSPTFKSRVREGIKLAELQELGDRARSMALEQLNDADRATLKKLRESGNSFSLGLYPDEAYTLPGVSDRGAIPFENVVLPSTNSPYSKQMLFADYLDMNRKSFEAATRNPLGKRIVRLIPQFVLGRSLLVTIPKQPKYQEEWDMFWKKNKMKLRSKQIFRELLIYGEIFLRYFRLPPGTPGGLAVRSIDPITIWDIITNPDDLEDVYYYHQQYVISNFSAPVTSFYGRTSLPPATLVIRQIAANEIDHFKINSTSSEKRGRSELFAILGYLQRFRQFVDDRLLLSKVRSMFAIDVSVEGQQRDVDAAEAQFVTPPGTGSVIVHNKNVAIDFKSAQAADSTSAAADAELFLKVIAVGAGVSQSFLGVGGAEGTRAGALIQTEPDVKNFEDYQEMVQGILEMAADRVFIDAQQRRGLKVLSTPPEVGVTFPSIAQEDRSSKLKDVGFSESMSWLSKRRAANIAADEFKLNDYDYDTEQKEIAAEIAGENDLPPVISSSMQQVAKGPSDVISSQLKASESGGEFEPEGPDTEANQDKAGGQENALTNPGAQTGSVVPSNVTRALPSTGTNLRGKGLDRADEKARINLRSSERPPRKGGWSPTAREAAAEARRKKQRIREARRNGDQKD
jgi:hypothetical protein